MILSCQLGLGRRHISGERILASDSRVEAPMKAKPTVMLGGANRKLPWSKKWVSDGSECKTSGVHGGERLTPDRAIQRTHGADCATCKQDRDMLSLFVYKYGLSSCHRIPSLFRFCFAGLIEDVGLAIGFSSRASDPLRPLSPSPPPPSWLEIA